MSKSRPAAMNLSSFNATRSSSASSPIASKSPEVLIASKKPDSRISVDLSSFDASSTSQFPLKDANFGGLMERQRGNPSHQEEEEDSEDSYNVEAEIWYYKGKQVTMGTVTQNRKAWLQPSHTDPALA